MRVKMLDDETVRGDKLNSKTFPKGWAGEVDDTVAKGWIKRGTAEELPADETQPVEFSEIEKAVLKAVARQAIDAVNGDEQVDPDTGEVSEQKTVAEILAGLTSKELKDFAKTKGVKVTARTRADIEADLVKLIEAEQAAAAA